MKDKLFHAVIELNKPNGETLLSLYNRGTYIGTLSMNTADVAEFMDRLAGRGIHIQQEVDTVEQGASYVGVKIGRIG